MTACFLKSGVLILINSMVMVAEGQYATAVHRNLLPGEIPVSKPGSYAESGKTYVLVNNISSERSAIFLGKDVTLDLNGYTISYADGNYDHVINGGFEEGITSWDLSKAPGAKVMNTADIHVFVGDKLMSLQAGDEIRSSYVVLPVANRSYIAMCGITGRHFSDPEMKGDLQNEMKVSVFVEDEWGRTITCTTAYGDTTMISCPVEKRSPRLGGGFVYAHLNNLPAGRYRIRVRADTDCLIDEIDIRPGFDVGIGVVEKTFPFGHYDHLYRSQLSAFFDYTEQQSGKAVAGIPVVAGRGSVTIRNGVIENKTEAAISWGVQSTAEDTKIILDNVSFITAGINCIAADLPQATITRCRFKVDNPFIVNRHGSAFYAVDLRGKEASEVSYSEFFGGQGCLVFKGQQSSVHHNYFVNNQSVTNHYSIMAMGDSSRIFDNRIEPVRGSGIEIYSHRYIDIFNNTIKVQSSAPTCEYGTEEYSTNAIRIADYRATPGSPNGAFGNRVYGNKIFIRAVNFGKPASYVPLSWAFFYSASAGDNEIFENDITIEHTAPESKALAAAFFITGGTTGFGGYFFNNRITSNVTPVWIAGKYGGTINTRIENNVIVKSANAPADYVPFRMGSAGCEDCVAKNVILRSNTVVNDSFSIRVEGKGHSYKIFRKLRIVLTDRQKNPLAGADIAVFDAYGTLVSTLQTDIDGSISADLLQTEVSGELKKSYSPYTLSVGKTKVNVPLNKDTTISLVVK